MINWIESLEVINGKGEHIKVAKSDFSDFVGMEGITGLIIKANLICSVSIFLILNSLQGNFITELKIYVIATIVINM